MFTVQPTFRRVLRAAAATATVVAALAAPQHRLAAQTASLLGTVVADSSKRPLPNAEVLLSNLDRSMRTDSAGRFLFSGVKAGKHKLVVRLVGYEPVNATITFDASNAVESEVVLRRMGTTLSTVNVKGTAAYSVREATFDENRKNAGRFLTRDVFEQSNGRPLVGLIVTKFSGLRVVTTGGKDVIAATRGAGGNRDCYLQIILNGLNVSRSGLFDLNTINSVNVIGLEFYSAATTPSKYNQFDMGAACGTIVVWTKD
ncbi:MAG: carboxypeptidase-like regulatory domain-containing protein [Phycisphaerae bacterium]|nr:carboxypeptidase-like regulatory domain-containing protein [Gemmatimonadaceae bacterium]